jgi:hypothetical protein
LPVGASAYFRIKAGRPDQLEWIFEFAFLAQLSIEMKTAAHQSPDALNLPSAFSITADMTGASARPAAIDPLWK